MTVCERCGQGQVQSRGELAAMGDEVVEMALCDAQHIGPLGPHGDQPANMQQEDPQMGTVGLDTHVGIGGLDTGVGTSRAPARARQSIPPRTRRQVVRRHKGRCGVPGCRNTAYLDVHHLTPQADGGGSGEDDLVLVCGCHHRAVHRGFLIIEGRPSTGLHFFHADGSAYGGDASPAAVEAHATAYGALKNLGFRESHVRHALDSVRADLQRNARFEEIMRAALAVLTE